MFKNLNCLIALINTGAYIWTTALFFGETGRHLTTKLTIAGRQLPKTLSRYTPPVVTIFKCLICKFDLKDN